MSQIKTVKELKQQSDEARKSLSEFYDRLPTINDPKIVIIELQEHISQLIDHIIDCHNFIDSKLLEDSTQNLKRHHPDYDYPDIFVTCCSSCHAHIHQGV